MMVWVDDVWAEEATRHFPLGSFVYKGFPVDIRWRTGWHDDDWPEPDLTESEEKMLVFIKNREERERKEAQEAAERERMISEAKVVAQASMQSMQKAAKAAAKALEQFAEVTENGTVVFPKVPADKTEIEYKKLHKIDSMAYSPMDGFKKNARFRDQHVGKVRGR